MKIFLAVSAVWVLVCSSPALAAEQLSSAPQVTPSQLQELQKTMQQDESIMATIQTLLTDPEVQAILNDPELLSAIMSNNTAALMASPKFLAVMNNPKIKEIQQKVGAH
jgi:TPP-dependent 2-oxoacid decarboxylase